MKVYMIALKELGITDKDIISILDKLSKEDIKKLFQGEYLDLQFKNNIDLNKYADNLSDKKKLEQTLLSAEQVIEKCKSHNINILTILSKWYPINLRSIDNPPVVLYYKGKRLSQIHKKSIACVGTRKVTDFGINAVTKLVPNLVAEGFTIVSGLAEGIDSYSHRMCLENNGNTVAVLAHGLDYIYPKCNIELAEQILENGGTILSEYPPGTKADKFRFVQRNRIVSGLSTGVLVFECNEKSGTMHTVRFCFEQMRHVFCPVPSNITESTKGLFYLLENTNTIGIPSTNAYDVIVHGLGYTLKNKEKLRKIKASNASILINNISVSPNNILKVMSSEETCTSSVRVDKQTYALYKEYLVDNHLSNRDVINALIVALVEKYIQQKKNDQ